METIKQPWAFSVEEVIKMLETNELGISEEEAVKRLAVYGKNSFNKKEKKSAIGLFLKQFISPLIFLLIGAAILTGILNEWIDTGVIIFAVLLNVSLGFYHEYHAENTLDKLTTYIKDRARVVRDGKEEEIDSSLLVPGDIIKLSYGTRVPADARIINLNNFHIDEAILTGESMPVEKNIEKIIIASEVAMRSNIIHAGTLIVDGYANAVVYATGNNTEIGKIAGIVSITERSKTPLQKGINKIAWLIFLLVIVIVIGIFILGIWRGEALLPMLILSSAVAVGAVPEALPIVLTIILAIGAERIASKKGIIRNLAAAETLGSTTLIMTDKTGTLTLADMQLVGIYTKDFLLSGKIYSQQKFSAQQESLLQMAIANIDVMVENPDEDKSKWIFKGRPFEVNIAKASRFHEIDLDDIVINSFSLVLPFNSTNKFSVAEKNGVCVVMGAPDILLKKSKISKEDYLKIESFIELASKEGKRLVGIATMHSKEKKKHINPDEIIDLHFSGLLAFYDPIRPEVPLAIANIESHGVKMVLVTGDLPGTAMSLVKELGWEVNYEEVLTGSEIKGMTDEELSAIISKIKIFARVTPEDKLRIGKLYQGLGEIVAMTGDGVNDAPALKAMDIGISLGSATDVAKSAADLVLLDDNFQTISHAIDEGRRIMSNVRKAFVYLMSNSLDSVFVVGGSLLFGLALPLTALQIIWVNLFTGSLPALAFAFDENIDKERSVGKRLGIIFTKEVKIITFGVGILSSVFLFIVYYSLLRIGIQVEIARSIFFVCFSSYVLAIAFSFRSLHKSIFSYAVFSNKKLNISIIIGIFLLIFTMTVPKMREIFDISPMPLSWVPFIILWLMLNIFLVEGVKYFIRKIHFK